MPFTQLEERIVYTETSVVHQCHEVTYADELTEVDIDDHEGGEHTIWSYHEKISERQVSGFLNGRKEVAKVEYDLAAQAFGNERLAKALNRNAGPKAALSAKVTYLQAQDKPICVTVDNATGDDVTITVEREAEADNPTDAKFTAKGAAGESISTTKFYAAPEGRNTITVTDKDGKVLANRIIEHVALDKKTKAELTEMADAKGIETTTRTTKAELIQSLADG